MKIERNAPARGARRAAGAYAKAAAAARLSGTDELVPASVLGIPEAEFTPRVRDAIMGLMEEVDSLRRELAKTRRQLDETEKAADLDPMLPVLGRRAFVRELTRQIAATSRYNTPASLIYFDLNYLKRVNDEFGHAAGDAALAHFARVLTGNTREADAVGRLGGDEFGVLLSHATHAQAVAKAARLAEILRMAPLLWEGREIPVSFAHGAFEVKPGDDANIAMARADEAMYAQKRLGRTAAE